MDVIRLLDDRFDLVHIFIGAHLAHAVMVCPFVHRQNRRPDVSNEDRGFEELHLFRRRDRGLDPASADHGPCHDQALDGGVFADDQDALRVDLPFHSPVDADRPIKSNHTFEVNPPAEEREVLVTVGSGLLPI